MKNFVLVDFMQIDVDHIIFERMMLDILQKGQVLVDLRAGGIGHFDINQNVLAGGGMKDGIKLLRVDFDRTGADNLVLGLAVKDAGDAASTAHGLQGSASGTGTLRYLERNGLGHKTL